TGPAACGDLSQPPSAATAMRRNDIDAQGRARTYRMAPARRRVPKTLFAFTVWLFMGLPSMETDRWNLLARPRRVLRTPSRLPATCRGERHSRCARPGREREACPPDWPGAVRQAP